MAIRSLAGGTITADGTEQTVFQVTQPGQLSGWISLREMQAGDQVIIRQYVLIGGIWDAYWHETYNDVQIEPAVYIQPKEIVSGMRITLEQTAGAPRNYIYDIMIVETPVVLEV